MTAFELNWTQMVGILFSKTKDYRWVFFSGLILFVSLGILVVQGPQWAWVFLFLGMILSCFSLWTAMKNPAQYPSKNWGIFYILLFLILGLASFLIFKFFISPLPAEKLTIPSFNRSYDDPEGLFQLGGPDWRYGWIKTPLDSGVILTPRQFSDYMGVMEIRILIRELEKTPDYPEEFLKNMALQLSHPISRTKASSDFQTHIKEVPLLRGGKGILSELVVKKWGVMSWFWLKQVSLFGIKNQNFLISVSATGLERHMLLGEVVAKGLFESLKIQNTGN